MLLSLLAFTVILACVLAVNSAWAQEMPPIEIGEKKYSGMDSRLADLYEAMLAGDGTDVSDSALQLSSGGQKVQVILEMASADSPIPQNLGIEVETSYENLIQATVPISNLEAIASDENVVMVKLPSTPIPAMVKPLAEDGDSASGYDLTYILIPAIALPAIAIALVWTRASRK